MESNVFNSFSFDSWADYVRREKIEEEILKQRMEQVNRLRIKLRRERELRAQADLLSDEDIDRLIGYINAGHSIRGGGRLVSQLSDRVPGYLPKDDEYIFNEIKDFYALTHSLKGLHKTIPDKFLHNHRHSQRRGGELTPNTKIEFLRFHFNRRFGDRQ